MTDKCCKNCKYFKNGYCINKYAFEVEAQTDDYKLIFENELIETGRVEEAVKENLRDTNLIRTKLHFETFLETFTRISRKARTRISNKMIELFKEDEDEYLKDVTDTVLEVAVNALNEHRELSGEYISVKEPDEFYCSEWE